MIQKFKQKLKSVGKSLCSSQRLKTLALMLVVGSAACFAQNAAGDYSAGTNALQTVTTEIFFSQNQTNCHTLNIILKTYNIHSFSAICNDTA